MNRYIVPKFVCALGTLVICAGIFFSVLNITLGNYSISSAVAVAITAILLLLAILAFNMKTARKKKIKKIIKCRTVEIFSTILFIICGLASLLIFNHCITVWLQTREIRENLNIHQLENILPEYKKYANQRIANYEKQLDEAISYRNARTQELTDLGFDLNSIEALKSQKARKIKKQIQIVYPHIYDTLKESITDSVARFIKKAEGLRVIATLPKQIKPIEQSAKSWEMQLVNFSNYKMKGENAEDFQFESTFGNVENILTDYTDYSSPNRFNRFIGCLVGIIALICMLFPYIFGNRSIKITKIK